jgi:hypothetical protein
MGGFFSDPGQSLNTGIGNPLGSLTSAGKGFGQLKNGIPGLKQQTGLSNDAGNAKEDEIKAGIGQEYGQLKGINSQMSDAGKSYYNSMSGVGNTYLNDMAANENQYRDKLSGLSQQASDQATNAQKVYNSSIQPNLTNAIEATNKELYDSNGNPKYMTLDQAQDPNNAVAAAYRGFYNNQAQGEGKAGLADVGIMQQLGAQATAQQLGGSGMPMTGGQMQMMLAQNQSQAGQAMSNVQKRQQNLKDQGLQQGWLQSQAAYDRGQGTLARQQGNVGALQSAQGTNLAQQQGLRGEQNQYGGQYLDSRNRQDTGKADVMGGLAGIQQQNTTGDLQRQAGLVSGEAGADRAMQTGDLQALNAQQTGRLQATSGLLGGGAGAMIGSVFGGGAGAQAGSYAGGGFLSSTQGGQPQQYGSGAPGTSLNGAASMFGYGQQQPQQPYVQNQQNPNPTGYGPQQQGNPQGYDPNAQKGGGIGGILGMLG